MIDIQPLSKIPNKGLYFMSLGGIGEIGANLDGTETYKSFFAPKAIRR